MKRARIEEEESYKIITPPQKNFNEGLVEQYDIDFAIKRCKKYLDKVEEAKNKSFYFDSLQLIINRMESDYDEKDNSVTIKAYDVCCLQEVDKEGKLLYGPEYLQGLTWDNEIVNFKIHLSYVPKRNYHGPYWGFDKDDLLITDFPKLKQSLLGQRFLPCGELFDSICFLNRKRAV